MFSTSRKKARAALLDEAKRQMFKQDVTFAEDKRPISFLEVHFQKLKSR